MEKDRSTKIIAIVALCFAVIGTTVAFAAMSTDLTITGEGVVDPLGWEVSFVEGSLKEPTITGLAAVTTPPTLTITSVGDFAVKLVQPGDSVTYTFDVTNSGGMDAVLSYLSDTQIECTSTASPTPITSDEEIVCRHVSYNFTYADAISTDAVAQGDKLASGVTRTLKLTLIYDPEAKEIPTDDVKITGLDKTLTYTQAPTTN